MTLNADEIRSILPHRYPFLLIDKVTECEPGKSASAIKCVSQNEEFFTGHFPEKSIMPGVLIIEALAQTGAIALLTENRGRLALLAGIKNAKFSSPVVPGDVLELSSRIVRKIGGIGMAEGEAFVSGASVCKAEIMFALQ